MGAITNARLRCNMPGIKARCAIRAYSAYRCRTATATTAVSSITSNTADVPAVVTTTTTTTLFRSNGGGGGGGDDSRNEVEVEDEASEFPDGDPLWGLTADCISMFLLPLGCVHARTPSLFPTTTK